MSPDGPCALLIYIYVDQIRYETKCTNYGPKSQDKVLVEN